MSPLEFILIHLSGEAAKTIQACSGFLKYGPEHRPHARDRSQRERLQRNVSELMASLEALNAELKAQDIEEIEFSSDEEIDDALDKLLSAASRIRLENGKSLQIIDPRTTSKGR